MRTLAILGSVTGLLLSAQAASAEACDKLEPQSAQIACLQKELETLRQEVARLRSGHEADQAEHVTVRMVDQRILEAVTRLEGRLLEKSQPRVHLLDR